MEGIERCPNCGEEVHKNSDKFLHKIEGNHELYIHVCPNCGYEEIVNSLLLIKRNDSQKISKLSFGSK